MLDRKLGGFISANPPAPSQASAQGVWDGNQQIVAQLQNAWPLPPNVVQRSLRFNSADSTYLNRTPTVAGNGKQFTFSAWIKRGALSVQQTLLSCYTGAANTDSTIFHLYITNDALDIGGAVSGAATSAVFRDPSAWYHIVVSMDTDQTTAANQMKFYVNGSSALALASSVAYTPGTTTPVNQLGVHMLGRRSTVNDRYFSGYMAEVNFIDGQALTPSSFGETDPQTGIWVPKRYTGTYGTNGFRLPFSNNSSTTALGFDASGNGNNFTPNGFSVTPGSGNDSLLDVPSLYGATDTGIGGEVRGNYATFNPLSNPGGSTLSNGNLDVSTPNATAGRVLSTMAVSSGKWYCEFTVTSVGAGFRTGIVKDGFNNGDIIGKFANEYAYYSDGNKYSNDTAATYGASYTTNDVIGVALDLDNGTLSFSKNGVSQGVAYTGITGSYTFGICDITGGGGVSATANFGQRPFAFPAPAGFKALCTTNLPAPAIGQTSNNQADDHFNVVTYVGNGNARSITGLSFQPDLVWIKQRTGATTAHSIQDSVRGVDKHLTSNGTDIEANSAAYGGGITAFNANGFSIGTWGAVNENTQSYVAWCWNAGGATVTNNAGSNGATIASTYRANKAAGFSVVTYTGNGVDGATVAHGLGAAPAFIIVKSRSNAFNWGVWHKNLAKYDANHAYAIGLNLTRPADATAQYAVFYPGVNTANVFGLGNESTANQSNATYVAYCFAEVPGFSGFGSYTGNGSADGPFVHLGFRPAFILLKNISQAYGWQIYDSKRNPTNRVNLGLYPNVSNGEGTEAGAGPIDFLSNGFKIRDATWDELNGSTRTYLYIAFAEAPFRLSSAR